MSETNINNYSFSLLNVNNIGGNNTKKPPSDAESKSSASQLSLVELLTYSTAEIQHLLAVLPMLVNSAESQTTSIVSIWTGLTYLATKTQEISTAIEHGKGLYRFISQFFKQ